MSIATDTISEMSAGQGTLSTAADDSLVKDHSEAHELRLNLIYSGTYLLGMVFLCLRDLASFTFYPAIIFLVLHVLLELRHDLVHKTRYYAHTRYTQATPNDRSYGGDLYVANLAQSWFVAWGVALLLAAQILRMRHEFDFHAYKAIYFAASFFFVLSGATTMLSRGCGSFYFLGRSPGFSARDQAANFIYVTSTVLLLIVASWQVDHGTFDLPLKIGETIIFWMWLVASIMYGRADVNRLIKETRANGTTVTRSTNDDEEEYADKYVQMSEDPSKSSRRVEDKRHLDHEKDLRTPRTRSDATMQTGKDRGNKGLDDRPSSWGRVFAPLRSRRGSSVMSESDTGPTDSLPTISTTGDYSHSAQMMPDMASLADGTTDSRSTLQSMESARKVARGRSWRSRLGFGSDTYCGMDSTQACNPIVVDPALGPPRKIPGRDADSDSQTDSDTADPAPTKPKVNVSNPVRSRNVTSPQQTTKTVKSAVSEVDSTVAPSTTAPESKTSWTWAGDSTVSSDSSQENGTDAGWKWQGQPILTEHFTKSSSTKPVSTTIDSTWNWPGQALQQQMKSIVGESANPDSTQTAIQVTPTRTRTAPQTRATTSAPSTGSGIKTRTASSGRNLERKQSKKLQTKFWNDKDIV